MNTFVILLIVTLFSGVWGGMILAAAIPHFREKALRKRVAKRMREDLDGLKGRLQFRAALSRILKKL